MTLNEPDLSSMPDVFPPEERRGLYRAIYTRRDIRHFRNHPIPDPVLARIIQAAHQGPSVGFMQPWDLILIRDLDVRGQIKELFERERQAASCYFDEPRRTQYLSLKLEGILESPVNVCITCDPTRAGEVLGRNSIQETDVYSTCCAVQNLWLAARSEGVGVGWVSVLKMPQLRKILGVPHHVIPVAYLCLGYPVEFPGQPTLQTAGWRDRLPVSDLLHFDGWETNVAQADWEDFQRAIGAEQESWWDDEFGVTPGAEHPRV